MSLSVLNLNMTKNLLVLPVLVLGWEGYEYMWGKGDYVK